MLFYVGQKVIVNQRALGAVAESDDKTHPNSDKEVWVRLDSRCYASCFDINNVKPWPLSE